MSFFTLLYLNFLSLLEDLFNLIEHFLLLDKAHWNGLMCHAAPQVPQFAHQTIEYLMCTFDSFNGTFFASGRPFLFHLTLLQLTSLLSAVLFDPDKS